jgi:DNA-binding NarL/FixJ family response regulator
MRDAMDNKPTLRDLEDVVRDKLSGKVVLIVDDVGLIRKILRSFFALMKDIDIREASDGHLAIARINEDPQNIGLVVIDVMMEKLNGIEVLQQIRAGHTECPRDTTVVVLSGRTSLAFKDLIERLDGNAFLYKPVRYAQFMETIAEALKSEIHLMSRADYESVDLSSIQEKTEE